MKLFGPMYERTLRWARHRNATWLLAFLSFIEAIFFPIPPEVMLAPMCLAQPRRGFWFATISLAFSLLGAVVGYLLGHYAYELVKPGLAALGWLRGSMPRWPSCGRSWRIRRGARSGCWCWPGSRRSR